MGPGHSRCLAAHPVGKRFFLAPPWCDQPTPAGRFGSRSIRGWPADRRHPATQLALEAIERHIRPGDAVADIGTGSGILAAAAALVGAGRVVACDVDPDAVRIAHERVQLPMFVGSAGAIRSAWADVVIANIDAATIEDLRRNSRGSGSRNRMLILTGFPESGDDSREAF